MDYFTAPAVGWETTPPKDGAGAAEGDSLSGGGDNHRGCDHAWSKTRWHGPVGARANAATLKNWLPC